MKKAIYLLLLTGMSWMATAEMAYYKEIPLDDVRHLRATGHINIELKAGDENKLELFLKQGVDNHLKIGVETKASKKSGQEARYLHIREVFNHGEEQKAGHIADIVITSNQLTTAILGGVNSFKADGYHSPTNSFYLSVGRTEKVSLSNLNLNKLSVSSYFNSTVALKKSQIDTLTLKQSRESKTTLTDLQLTDGHFDLRSKSELELIGVNVERLQLKGSNRSRVVADSTTEIGFASFHLRNSSTLDFSSVEINPSNRQIRLQHSATLYLGKEEIRIDQEVEQKSVTRKEGLNE